MKFCINVLRLLITFLVVLFIEQSVLADNLEIAKSLYKKGFRNYDIGLLEEAYDELKQVPKREEYDYLLLKGLCLKRLHFIYYIKGDKKRSKEYGKHAIKIFSELLKNMPDSIEALCHKGMVFQSLATFSWINGARYGPKTKKVFNIIKELSPEHFLFRLMTAINYLEAPHFAGGDVEKAVKSFIKLIEEYPDNEDIQIYLSRAYYKEKKYREGFEIIEEVMRKNPLNIYAEKVRIDIKNKLE